MGSLQSPSVNIGWPINTVGNEASIGISADGQEILIYKDDMGDGNIYSSSLDGDTWTIPVKLNSNINSKWWEPGAFLCADGNTLYFVSDRPGGYGGTDIYKSRKMPNGDWGKAINLGPTINTPYDEQSPFIHPDGFTLFFSSKGHKTMGGYDVFFSRTLMSDNQIWIAPINVGFPINTPGDDIFYTVSTDKKSAYYSSVKDSSYGASDNYMITFADTKEESLSVLKGIVSGSNEEVAKNIVITVTDNATNEIVGVYLPNSKTGKYLFILTPGKNYNISYEADGLLFYSENRYVSEETSYYETNRAIELSDIKVGSKVILNNIFFDVDQTKLRPFSKSELNKIHKFLVKYPKISVAVCGYADSKGNDEYNKKLSLERAQEVINYLNIKGIEKERMVALGYGESETALVQINKSVNIAARQSDRRVELKIIEVK